MQQVLNALSFVAAHASEFIVAIVAVLAGFIAIIHALIALFVLIPGEQPEATLQKIADFVQKWVDFISKYSKK